MFRKKTSQQGLVLDGRARVLNNTLKGTEFEKQVRVTENLLRESGPSFGQNMKEKKKGGKKKQEDSIWGLSDTGWSDKTPALLEDVYLESLYQW